MSFIKKSCSFPSKHHPYFLKERSKSNQEKSIEKNKNDQVKVQSSNARKFVSRSESEVEKESVNWKLSFCGVLSSNSSDDLEKKFNTPDSVNSFENPDTLPSSKNLDLAIDDCPSTSPVTVPLRESRKRKLCFRSSGGYFFDKYMKRFHSKSDYGNAISHSETIDELKVSNCDGKECKSLQNFEIKSNREDFVYHRVTTKSFDPAFFSSDNSIRNDDLYPLNFDSTSLYSTETVYSQYSSKGTSSAVFPSSPTQFWGDAKVGVWDDLYDPTVSPVPSVTDGAAAACRYSDSYSESLKAMETLYLCNFRVAVDGDWLCLKEICDECAPSNLLFANKHSDEPGNNTSTVNVDETFDLIAAKNSHEMKVERKNLLNMAKLSIKGLIESSLAAGHTLDSDDQRLEQFFILIEYVLRQGLKTPKNFFLQNKYFWPPLEAIEKLCPEACEITNSVRSLPGVKTHLGRGRAWIRLAVMQKKLADYFKVLVENRQVFSEWYDEGALVMSEEGVVLLGHLVGLNCIDANLCMKGDDLDNQVTVIDYSLYMKDSNRYLNQSENEEQNKESALQKLLDQKNYLEERNRHLETVTGELQKKTDVLSVSNQQLATELQALKIQIAMLKEDKDRVIVEKQHLAADHQKNLEDREKDLDSERETLRQSKADMDEMYAQIQQQLKQESNARTDLEKELEVEKSIKDELEMAMKLLEKDIYVKQDGLITLREQLDKVKSINVDIYQKLQVKTELEEKKNKTIEKLQKETEAFSSQIKRLQAELKASQNETEEARNQTDESNHLLDDSEKKRSVLLTNLQIEREWRQALQSDVEKHLQEITLQKEKLDMLSTLKEELQQVNLERDDLKQTCHEQEITISDLAGHLGQSKQVLGDLKEVHKSLTGNMWEKDKEVKSCLQCEKPFNLSRRKHHCRNCGQIFCNSCSDNTMPLASSAKPVRVCDGCHTTLLQRFSAGT